MIEIFYYNGRWEWHAGNEKIKIRNQYSWARSRWCIVALVSICSFSYLYHGPFKRCRLYWIIGFSDDAWLRACILAFVRIYDRRAVLPASQFSRFGKEHQYAGAFMGERAAAVLFHGYVYTDTSAGNCILYHMAADRVIWGNCPRLFAHEQKVFQANARYFRIRCSDFGTGRIYEAVSHNVAAA